MLGSIVVGWSLVIEFGNNNIGQDYVGEIYVFFVHV